MDIQPIIAFTSAVTAIAVGFFTGGQWFTNRARLKHELFDRRYAIYEKITQFLADVLINSQLPPGREEEFLRETKLAFFVFNCDPNIKSLVEDIYGHAIHLHTVIVQIKETTGDERMNMLNKEQEIRNWFMDTLKSIEKKFENYLRLKH